jgi:hypothetical protein
MSKVRNHKYDSFVEISISQVQIKTYLWSKWATKEKFWNVSQIGIVLNVHFLEFFVFNCRFLGWFNLCPNTLAVSKSPLVHSCKLKSKIWEAFSQIRVSRDIISVSMDHENYSFRLILVFSCCDMSNMMNMEGLSFWIFNIELKSILFSPSFLDYRNIFSIHFPLVKLGLIFKSRSQNGFYRDIEEFILFLRMR